jgi:hypothetical protein
VLRINWQSLDKTISKTGEMAQGFEQCGWTAGSVGWRGVNKKFDLDRADDVSF